MDYNNKHASDIKRFETKRMAEGTSGRYMSNPRQESLSVVSRKKPPVPFGEKIILTAIVTAMLIGTGWTIHDSLLVPSPTPVPTPRAYGTPAPEAYSCDHVKSRIKEAEKEYGILRDLMVANGASEKQLDDFDKKAKEFKNKYDQQLVYDDADKIQREKVVFSVDATLVNIYDAQIDKMKTSTGRDYANDNLGGAGNRIETLTTKIESISQESNIVYYDAYNPIETSNTKS